MHLPWRRGAFARLVDADDALAAALFDAAPGGLVATDADGAVVRVNAALRRMCPAAAPGVPASSVFAPDGRDAAQAALSSVLAGRLPRVEIASARLAPGHPVSVVATALIDGGRRVDGALLAFADLAPLQDAKAQLDASQALHAVGRMTAGVAHDVNNLLAVAAGAADAILARPGVDQATLEDARLVAGAARRGAAMAELLLRLGRDGPADARIVRLNDAARAVAALLRRSMGSARLELELEEPGRAARIDPGQLDRVLTNLLLNARDAMPDGGRVTLRTGRATVLRGLAGPGGEVPPGRYALIEVIDEGRGVPPEALPRLFEPYFTTRPEAGGHGIGLSGVLRIVREAGGFVAVDSRPGRTGFRLHLPPLDPPVEPPHDPAAPPPGPGRTVLLADDDEPLRRLVARVLATQGWTVLESASGEAALDRDPAELAAIDAVVTDVAMAGIDGPTLVARLRERRPGLPAVLISGYLPSGPAQPGVRHLTKPYASADLIAAVREAMAGADHS